MKRRTVYSSEHGRMCPDCRRPLSKCNCKAEKKNAKPKTDGIVRVSRETKGRKGSGVSIITGLPLNDADLKKLAKQLKKTCGSGGTVKDRTIEIQGDHRDKLVAELQKLGYTAKKAGG